MELAIDLSSLSFSFNKEFVFKTCQYLTKSFIDRIDIEDTEVVKNSVGIISNLNIERLVTKRQADEFFRPIKEELLKAEKQNDLVVTKKNSLNHEEINARFSNLEIHTNGKKVKIENTAVTFKIWQSNVSTFIDFKFEFNKKEIFVFSTNFYDTYNTSYGSFCGKLLCHQTELNKALEQIVSNYVLN